MAHRCTLRVTVADPADLAAIVEAVEGLGHAVECPAFDEWSQLSARDERLREASRAHERHKLGPVRPARRGNSSIRGARMDKMARSRDAARGMLAAPVPSLPCQAVRTAAGDREAAPQHQRREMQRPW